VAWVRPPGRRFHLLHGVVVNEPEAAARHIERQRLQEARPKGQLSRTNSAAATVSFAQPSAAGQAENRQHHGSCRIRYVTYGETPPRSAPATASGHGHPCATWQ